MFDRDTVKKKKKGLTSKTGNYRNPLGSYLDCFIMSEEIRGWHLNKGYSISKGRWQIGNAIMLQGLNWWASCYRMNYFNTWSFPGGRNKSRELLGTCIVMLTIHGLINLGKLRWPSVNSKPLTIVGRGTLIRVGERKPSPVALHPGHLLNVLPVSVHFECSGWKDNHCDQCSLRLDQPQ